MMTTTMMTILMHCAWFQGQKPRKTKQPRRGRRRFKMNLYFTTESWDTLKSFAWFITVKAITKLNLERSDK